MVQKTQLGFAIAILSAALLVVYGIYRFPGVMQDPSSRSGLLGFILILVFFGVTAYFGPSILERRSPLALRMANRAGLLAGAIFILEMLLEIILLPAYNSAFGQIEYGLVLVIFFFTALDVARRTSWGNGVLAALWAALIASLLFILGIFLFFFLFNGTDRYMQVLAAEGSLEDFARSGMTDLNLFLMGDFLGAAFFYSLLLPLVAALVGCIGAGVGRGVGYLQTKAASAPEPK
jgi:hypothetical protein